MSETRCERTDLLVSQCACPDHRGVDEYTLTDQDRAMQFRASYSGHCRECDEDIQPGEWITLRLGYVHVECTD